MKYAVSSLQGPLLDAAVAKAEGWEWRLIEPDDGQQFVWLVDGPVGNPEFEYRPSTNWQHGGLIIERECIAVHDDGKGNWFGRSRKQCVTPRLILDIATDRPTAESGTTPLIAAMRAFCASKFGEEVELP